MRIISGSFKGKKISDPKDIKTRPLKDLTKESIFNIIKHSNPNYSVQGAVDAGTRLENLKYQTINKAANSLKGNFGNSTAGDSRYNGKYDAPYTLKSKTNTPVCFIRGGKTKYLGKSYC